MTSTQRHPKGKGMRGKEKSSLQFQLTHSSSNHPTWRPHFTDGEVEAQMGWLAQRHQLRKGTDLSQAMLSIAQVFCP